MWSIIEPPIPPTTVIASHIDIAPKYPHLVLAWTFLQSLTKKSFFTVLGTSVLIQVIILTKRLLNCKSQEQYKNGYKMRVEYL